MLKGLSVKHPRLYDAMHNGLDMAEEDGVIFRVRGGRKMIGLI